jgi:hypothetical protein
VGDVDGKRPAGAADDRRIAQKSRDRLGFERRGHHDDHQVRPHGLADFAEQRDGQIGVQAPLVELIQHDAANALKVRVVEQLPRQHALSHDVQPRLGGDFPFEADLIPDLAADRPLVFIGDALGGGAGGDAAGLEQHQVRMLARQQLFLHDRRRDTRCLPRARLGDEHERLRLPAHVRERFGDHGIDRQWDHRQASDDSAGGANVTAAGPGAGWCCR